MSYETTYFAMHFFSVLTALAISIAKYWILKETYYECRAKYEREFRETKKYKRFLKYKNRRDKILKYFMLKDEETI